jgi:hypothetical protein
MKNLVRFNWPWPGFNLFSLKYNTVFSYRLRQKFFLFVHIILVRLHCWINSCRCDAALVSTVSCHFDVTYKILVWFWFIFDLVNELITIINLKIETNITTLDYGKFDMLIKIHTIHQTNDTMTQKQQSNERLKLNLTCELRWILTC